MKATLNEDLPGRELTSNCDSFSSTGNYTQSLPSCLHDSVCG